MGDPDDSAAIKALLLESRRNLSDRFWGGSTKVHDEEGPAYAALAEDSGSTRVVSRSAGCNAQRLLFSILFPSARRSLCWARRQPVAAHVGFSSLRARKQTATVLASLCFDDVSAIAELCSPLTPVLHLVGSFVASCVARPEVSCRTLLTCDSFELLFFDGCFSKMNRTGSIFVFLLFFQQAYPSCSF